MPGLPLVYLGDEIAHLNDYSYLEHPEKVHDSRWVHRFSPEWIDGSTPAMTREGEKIFTALKEFAKLRMDYPALYQGDFELKTSSHPSILAFIRRLGSQWVLIVANFSDSSLVLSTNELRLYSGSESLKDLLTGESLPGRLYLKGAGLAILGHGYYADRE
jgi:amylosucrase